MPPDLPNVQELNLKKRARRRLVGAIALVLLMVIILPRILQDRAALAPQEAIKITMPEASSNQQVKASAVPVAPKVDLSAADESTKNEAPIASEAKNEPKAQMINTETSTTNSAVAEASSKVNATKNVVENQKSANKVEKKTEVKAAPNVKVTESKVTDAKALQKSDGNFTIQVGVYSDIANVKQLQTKLKQAGFASHTEKITTPKGEKIRLRAGSFASRQEAANALIKVQETGLSGMVITDE